MQCRGSGAGSRHPRPLQVLAQVGLGVDGPRRARALAGDQGADVDDPLALLARNPRPVIGVGGVGQVLVLGELVDDRVEQVLDAQTRLAGLQHRLDRVLLRAVDDVLDHRPGVEVLEVHDFLVAVGVGDLQEPVVVDLGVHPLDDLLDHRLDAGGAVAAELGQVVGVQRQLLGQVLREDILRRFGIRALDLDLHVEAAGPQDGRVDHVLAVGGADHDDVLEPLHAVDLGQQLRDHRRLDVRADPGAAGAEDGVHLVEEHDHRRALGGLLAGALEDQPDVPLGLADELVEQLGALDVEEVRLGFAGVVAAHLGHLLGQRVRHRLGDQRLTATGRAVEQHAFGWPQRVLAVELLVQERQLDGVTDLLDLAGQATDVLVADVGDLLEHQVLDLGLGDALEGIAGLGVHQQRVAGPQLARPGVVVEGVRVTVGQVVGDQRLGQPHDALLVGVADHQGPVPVGQQLAQGGDLADRFEGAGFHHRQRLVETNRLALAQQRNIDVRRAGQPHLAARGEHVDGVVLVRGEQDAVAAGRLPEPVDFLAQGQQLLTGLFEGLHQLRVPGRKGVDAGLQLMHVTRGAGAAVRADGVLELLAQHRRLATQFLQLGLVAAGHV
ncbi:hypothetical protein MAP_1839 [Mycobacterium avium subsp. paratuberculosis K-10]|uniref:Uncharacterized protein n=1 Tax=Mycolicibacterium paratuberculosis (strain ATCC BAA-968 / K-10) TaxID=262316 RepID=Q73YW4_MYCPA|nr:hypothetical protein MAP_1839 [Mycobacterium avium subsp. paratuberculosis K-10]